MHLTTALFEQVVSTLRSDDRGTRDQRDGPRVGLRAKVKMTLVDLGNRRIGSLEGWVRDLSVSGIGLTLCQTLASGSLFIIQLPIKDSSTVSLRYKVAYSHAVAGVGNVFTIGGLFDKLLSDQDAESLGALAKIGRRSRQITA
jgi:hypothetical protein